jgi:hypothetical protein
MLVNKTFFLEQFTQVFSFLDAFNELKIFNMMKHLHCQGSNKYIFT